MSVQMTEARLENPGGLGLCSRGGGGGGASGGGKPPEAQAGGLCWVAMAYGFGERTDRGTAQLFHLEKFPYPQLIPTSSKALDLTTLIYRGWVCRCVITHDPALLGSCQKRISEETGTIPTPGAFSNLF